MDVIVIESKAFQLLLEQQVSFILNKMNEVERNDKNNKTGWLTLGEAKKILPYKSRTKWQELRDDGKIVFAQFGRKILYQKSSLESYIENNKIA